MSLFIRLQTNFWTHRKTMRLKLLIGNDAFWAPPRLWSYAAENQPDGDFSDYKEDELGMLLGYSSNATSIISAMQQAGFMDGMKVHDWNEHNSYHQVFSERAKTAAKARWDKEESTKEEMKGQDKTRQDKTEHCVKHATSNATSINSPLTVKFMASIGALYRRRESTPWDGYESKKLKEILKRPDCESELAEIEKFYSWYKFRRQNIITLLNNWSGELDKYRTQTQNETSKVIRPSFEEMKSKGAA